MDSPFTCAQSFAHLGGEISCVDVKGSSVQSELYPEHDVDVSKPRNVFERPNKNPSRVSARGACVSSTRLLFELGFFNVTYTAIGLLEEKEETNPTLSRPLRVLEWNWAA